MSIIHSKLLPFLAIDTLMTQLISGQVITALTSAFSLFISASSVSIVAMFPPFIRFALSMLKEEEADLEGLHTQPGSLHRTNRGAVLGGLVEYSHTFSKF
jgi:hypothetical protein